jgi:general secretion pathway protein D
LLASGCAARNAYRQGRSEAKKGNWDLAVARLTKALQKDPDNIEYKLALESARVEASQYHYKEARKHLAAQDLDKAVEEMQIAANYDPSNKSASDDLLIVRGKIEKRDEERRQRSELEAMKARAQAARVPIPVLSARSPAPITLKFADQSLQKILDSLGKLAGVNIVYDADFRDKRWSLDVSNVSFQDALDQITMVNRLFYKVLDQNTVIIVPESPQKRRSYDDNLVKTFYLENAEVNETLTIIKTVAGITKAVGNPTLGAITVTGTPDELALAAKIVEANDKAKGEVMAEVQILEVNRIALKQYGIELSNYTASVTFSPTGAANEVSGGLTQVRAHLLSSLNLADFVVSVPSQLLTKFVQNDSNVKILAAPRLRAAEGKKTSLRIGTEVPIPVTTFTATGTGTANAFTPATSFQYRNVGVNLELTPKVNATGDITLEIVAEFSSIGDDRNVGTTQNPITVPTFLTRNVTGILRIKDGETSLIGGLLQGREADSFAGVLGLQSIPILNKVFTSRKKEVDENEVLISITPHIVRAPKLTDEDFASLYIGTKETVKVPSARPLFGPPDEAASPTPPPAPAPSPQAQPVVPQAAPQPAPQSTPPAAQAPQPGPQAPPPAGASPQAPPRAGVAAPGAGAPRVRTLLTPPEVRLKAGESGAFSIVVLGATGVTAVELRLAYDPAAFDSVNVSPGSLLTLDGANVGTELNLESGPGRVRAKFTRAVPTTGSGALATVQFKTLKPGSATLAVESLTLTTSTGDERPTPPGPGRVEVTP